MNQINFEQNLKSHIPKLLEMARENCWNDISNDCSFILSEIKNDKNANFNEQRIERKKINNKKKPKTFDHIIKDLNNIYFNLYDVNLYIYKSTKKKTIVEIQFYLKSSLDDNFLEKVKTEDPMIHSKIPIPPYSINSSKKYDVNWEFGGFRY